MKYYKLGGLHWLELGRLRVMWCIKKPELLQNWADPDDYGPEVKPPPDMGPGPFKVPRTLTTWTADERNHFIF